MRISVFGILIVLLTVILSVTAAAHAQTDSPLEGQVAQGRSGFSSADDATGKIMSILGIDPSAFPKVKVNVLINKTCALTGSLTKENFKVVEDGGGMPIDDFYFAGNAAGQKLDLAIVFDDTGSMGEEINAMKTKAKELTSGIKAAGLDANYSLVSFKDRVTIRTNWTADPDRFIKQISSLQAYGGNDEPEASLDAIEAVLSQGFRPDAQKVILVITDAHAHYKGDGTEFSGDTKEDVERDLKDSGAIFIPVSPTFSTKSSYVDLKDIANALQSQWIDINSADFSTILEQFKEMITGIYVIGYTSPNEGAPLKRTVAVSVDAPGCVAGDDSSSYYTEAVENQPPIIEDLSAVQSKAKEITWTTNATDSDNDQILYRYFLNNKSMTGWIDRNNWIFNATDADAGENQIEVQIRDGKHEGSDGYDDAKSFRFNLSSMKLRTQTWERTFGGPGADKGYSVQQTSDGGYIVAGQKGDDADVWLIKTDSSGNMEWDKTFGGSGLDLPGSVQQTDDGGYVIFAQTTSYGAGGRDAWLIKTNSLGNKQWDNTFGGNKDEPSFSGMQTSDGGYILAGTTWSYGEGSSDILLIKTDQDGNVLWDRTFGSSRYDSSDCIEQTSDGGYIIGGLAFLSSSDDDQRGWLIKTDATGNEIWTKTLSKGQGNIVSVQQIADGGYVIAGSTFSFGPSGLSSGSFLMKTDSSGNEEWTRTFNGNFNSVQQTSDGGYIVAGSFSHNSYLMKTDSEGHLEWERTLTHGGSGFDEAVSVMQTNDGGYILTGSVGEKAIEGPDIHGSYKMGGDDVLLIKTDPTGNV